MQQRSINGEVSIGHMNIVPVFCYKPGHEGGWYSAGSWFIVIDMEYRQGSHPEFKINEHFVWVTKYRFQVLHGDFSFRKYLFMSLTPFNWRLVMKSMKCPDCGSQGFYVKDPEDQYNISEFDVIDGEIVVTAVETGSDPLEVGDDTETFCNRCAWHDQFKSLKQIK